MDNTLCAPTAADVHPHDLTHFVVYPPRGAPYWPEMTIDEARQLVAERSAYPGQPGWKIVPFRLALSADGSRMLRRDELPVVGWQVRDAHGNEYGTFADHGEAAAFGLAVADRLELDKIHVCRVRVFAPDRAQVEASRGC